MLQKLQAKLHNRKGFTLIELIVVIAIIVILIALIAPNATKLIGTANQTKLDANAKTGYTAAMAFIADSYAKNGKYPASVSDTEAKTFVTTDVQGEFTFEYVATSGALTSCTYKENGQTGTYPKAGSSSSSSNA